MAARKKIQDLIAELRSWLPNYDHGPDSFPTTFYRILASLPGGDELEDMGYEPMGGIGWHEADLLGRVLEGIQDKRDVEDLVKGLMSEEEENVGEMREAPRKGTRKGAGSIDPYVGATVEFPTSDGGAAYGIVTRFEDGHAMVRWTDSGTITGVPPSLLRVVPSEWGGTPAREARESASNNVIVRYHEQDKVWFVTWPPSRTKTFKTEGEARRFASQIRREERQEKRGYREPAVRESDSNRNEYLIKITGTPRLSGEYSGGKTIESARAEAASFGPLPAGSHMRIVRYDRDGSRIIFSEDVRTGSSEPPAGPVTHEAAHENLIPFHSWKDVLAHAKKGAPLFYKAPMDHRAVRLSPRKEQGQEAVYEAHARTIRVWPYGSTGRGRSRTADPFTADSGHLDRFLRPTEGSR